MIAEPEPAASCYGSSAIMLASATRLNTVITITVRWSTRQIQTKVKTEGSGPRLSTECEGTGLLCEHEAPMPSDPKRINKFVHDEPLASIFVHWNVDRGRRFDVNLVFQTFCRHSARPP